MATHPEIKGGQPVIAGTRVPVACIVLEYRLNRRVEDVLSAYPILTPQDVFGAFAYDVANRDEVDDAIRGALHEDDDARYGSRSE